MSCFTLFMLSQNQKRSGVDGLIEIENPNRVSQKSKKVAEVDVNAPKELSRRERYVGNTALFILFYGMHYI